jgi:outer membrane protein OmpA-like peptidoglycan-associated protein
MIGLVRRKDSNLITSTPRAGNRTPSDASGPVRTVWLTVMAGLSLTAGCTVAPAPRAYAPAIAPEAAPSNMLADAQFARLASQIATTLPETAMLAAPPGTCGPAATPVVHVVVPEQVLFATASDQPGPDAAAALDDVAGQIVRQVPGAELTVLGHTDAVGSDAYNLELSKRRAVTVLHAMALRGLDPHQLSAVAIGKRQPIADNATPAGRARNRRVEFLVSRCLAANLGVVTGIARDRALLAADEDPNRPAEVMRLDPAGGYAMAPLAVVFLKAPEGAQSRAAVVQASGTVQPSAVLPSAGVVRPAPAPHYQPRALSPNVQANPLGPAVPF